MAGIALPTIFPANMREDDAESGIPGSFYKEVKFP